MLYAGQHPPLPDPFAGITLYADLSQATLTARRNLIPITKILRNHKILYKLGILAKLLVYMHAITLLEKGLELLRKWRLLPLNGDPADPDPLQVRRNNNCQNRQNK